MINYNALTIRRVIMHKVIAKTAASESATVEYETAILGVEPNVISMIKQRLIEAAGKNSRAFELELSNISPGSFYELCFDLSQQNDSQFIARSGAMADLLAGAQNRSYMSGGYFILIEAQDPTDMSAVYVVIKADLHEALKYEAGDTQSKIQFLDKIFLSPSQKLFKLGILYEKTIDQTKTGNERFGCFLFDDQFRSDGKPAEYFYKDLLGFSIDKNHKIQSKLFYDKTESFIFSNISDSKKRKDLIGALKSVFSVSVDGLINPTSFAESVFEPGAVRDSYKAQVARSLPSSFVKDRTLVDHALNTRNFNFPDKIKVVGPEVNFDHKVQIIDSQESMSGLDPSSSEYTILKIKGKPYSNE